MPREPELKYLLETENSHPIFALRAATIHEPRDGLEVGARQVGED